MTGAGPQSRPSSLPRTLLCPLVCGEWHAAGTMAQLHTGHWETQARGPLGWTWCGVRRGKAVTVKGHEVRH